jgi:hypothetical protein
MSTQPDKKLEQIIFAEQHIKPWEVNGARIGVSTPDLTDIREKTSAARTAYDAALAARQASKAATVAADNALRAMRGVVAEAIKSIRLTAEATGDPDVYALAEIDPPAPRTPALPPTKPVNVSFTIEPTGALTLSWSNAAATPGFDASTQNVIYTVRRRVGSSGAFNIIGAVPAARSGRRGLTSFTDDTLSRTMAGAAGGVQYVIVPQRGTLAGPMSEVYSVTLGLGVDGAMRVSASAQPASGDLKMAA